MTTRSSVAFFLSIGTVLGSACGSATPDQAGGTITIPSGTELSSSNPQTNLLLQQQSGTISDLAILLKNSEPTSALPVNGDLFKQFQSSNSSLLVGPNAPLQPTTEGAAVLNPGYLQQRAEELHNTLVDLTRKKDEQEGSVRLTSFDSKANSLLQQQSGTISDLAALLKTSEAMSALPVSGDLFKKFRSGNSSLLVGPNAPLQPTADGAAVLNPGYLQQRAEELQNTVRELTRKKDEQEAFIKLTEPQVRALEQALGITPWDRWAERIEMGLVGLVIGLVPFLVAEARKRRPH